MDRQALVVGINEYAHLQRLNAPAQDAEAIAQLLRAWGEFKIWRLPEVQDKENNATRVGKKTPVTVQQLKDKLIQLFQPNSDQIPETALFYFSGHGLRADRGVQEGFLATSDIDTALNNWGLNLEWLRKLLQNSPIRRQIVWLDCCYSGELLNFDAADPGNRGQGFDRFFVAASRSYEVAYEETIGNHGVLTSALLNGLDPKHRADGLVTNRTLTLFIEQALKSSPQQPLCVSSGNKIILTTTGQQIDAASTIREGVCPYRSLAYFDCNEEDPKYFYGRTALTDDLLEKVRMGNFAAVLGASGSGKSSVVRAGLLHQLKSGEKLAGSGEWSIYIVDHPDEHPLQSLAKAFVPSNLSEIDWADQLNKAQNLIHSGALGLGQLITASQGSRVILVIDQFEECFAPSVDKTERQQFFECILGAVDRADRKLCLMLTMRVDFLGKCFEQEYAGLGRAIEANLVGVQPMSRDELDQAITEPAKQVGLEVEGELATQMLLDLEGSPGSLPLLQYTLTELWKRRSVNLLTVAAYQALDGIRGALKKRADEVYEALSFDEQAAAQRIFLELTQLGDGTEDTRKRISKRGLITPQQSEDLVDRVIQKLSRERLIVTSGLRVKGATSDRIEVVEVAHEALIRHWPRLREWIRANRTALEHKQTIEDAAKEWLGKEKPQEVAYLFQGRKLTDAEDFLQTHVATVPLSSLAQEFILVSQTERDHLLQSEQKRKHRDRLKIGVIMTSLAGAIILGNLARMYWLKGQKAEIVQRIQSKTATPEDLNTLLKEADQLKLKVDKKYSYTVNIQYNKNWDKDPDIAVAIDNYRWALRGVNALSIKNTNAEFSLAKTLSQYRIPKLKIDLINAQKNNNFGEFLPAAKLTDFENMYTESPLRTTYKILMRDFGSGADLDQDGKLLNKFEANQIPCLTLKEIEELWRNFTQGKCGWYGSDLENGESESNKCNALKKQSLLSVLFDPIDFTKDRINKCLPSLKLTIRSGQQNQ